MSGRIPHLDYSPLPEGWETQKAVEEFIGNNTNWKIQTPYFLYAKEEEVVALQVIDDESVIDRLQYTIPYTAFDSEHHRDKVKDIDQTVFRRIEYKYRTKNDDRTILGAAAIGVRRIGNTRGIPLLDLPYEATLHRRTEELVIPSMQGVELRWFSIADAYKNLNAQVHLQKDKKLYVPAILAFRALRSYVFFREATKEM